MKKTGLFTILMVVACNIFARGNVYFTNVNHVDGIEDYIRFKVVVRNQKEEMVKELYTDEIPPRGEAVILRDQLGIESGTLDFYIENLTKKTGFNECEFGLGYYFKYFTKIGGRHNGQKLACHLMEDS